MPRQEPLKYLQASLLLTKKAASILCCSDNPVIITKPLKLISDHVSLTFYNFGMHASVYHFPHLYSAIIDLFFSQLAGSLNRRRDSRQLKAAGSKHKEK